VRGRRHAPTTTITHRHRLSVPAPLGTGRGSCSSRRFLRCWLLLVLLWYASVSKARCVTGLMFASLLEGLQPQHLRLRTSAAETRAAVASGVVPLERAVHLAHLGLHVILQGAVLKQSLSDPVSVGRGFSLQPACHQVSYKVSYEQQGRGVGALCLTCGR
jgi:hypothetical protein